ncbi:hypothetical protein ACMFMG_010422 [Clarireedia jacksonii]
MWPQKTISVYNDPTTCEYHVVVSRQLSQALSRNETYETGAIQPAGDHQQHGAGIKDQLTAIHKDKQAQQYELIWRDSLVFTSSLYKDLPNRICSSTLCIPKLDRLSLPAQSPIPIPMPNLTSSPIITSTQTPPSPNPVRNNAKPPPKSSFERRALISTY